MLYLIRTPGLQMVFVLFWETGLILLPEPVLTITKAEAWDITVCRAGLFFKHCRWGWQTSFFYLTHTVIYRVAYIQVAGCINCHTCGTKKFCCCCRAVITAETIYSSASKSAVEICSGRLKWQQKLMPRLMPMPIGGRPRVMPNGSVVGS